jgi:hypothetical protein
MYSLRAECLEKLERKQARALCHDALDAPWRSRGARQEAVGAWEAVAQVGEGDVAAVAAARAATLRAAIAESAPAAPEAAAAPAAA